MIIKGQKLKAQKQAKDDLQEAQYAEQNSGASRSTEHEQNRRNEISTSLNAEENRASSEEEQLIWSEEAITAGEAPDRRETSSRDKRRQYRRMEDRQLISRAEEEANAIRENAYKEGFEEGMQKAEEHIGELRETIHGLLNAREEALTSIADDIAPLAVEVAERVIKTEVACDPTLIMNLVHDTIIKAGRNNKTILVKVNPEDVSTVKHELKENPIPNLQAELIVMEEPTIERGSCIVETNSGLVDASFSTQMEVLRKLFGHLR